MKHNIVLWLLLLSQLSWAQSLDEISAHPALGIKAEIIHSPVYLADEAARKAFLVSQFPWLNNPNNQLVKINETTSPTGHHFVYQQFFKGHKVRYNTLSLHTGYDHKHLVSMANLKQINADAFDGLDNNVEIVFVKGNPQAVVVTDYINARNEHIEAYIGLNGDTLFTHDRKLYIGKDTLVSGKVFLPNPIQSAKVVYGSPYVNANNSDVPALLAEQKTVNFKAFLENDTFKLKSKYLFYGEVSLPKTTPAWSLTPVFNYNRSHPFFEDINSFYHLTAYSNYVEKLGFGHLLDVIKIDAHAYNGGDNSSFDPATSPYTLEYGTGGVEDAEDGQVVVHEFGHALSQVASKNTSIGSERTAMEEGNADYFCVSYSRTFNHFNWHRVFTWDGHNEFWEGFFATTNKRYPKDLTNNSNNDREIWSSTLMCMYEKLGAPVVDSLVLLHLPFQAANTTMPQMARIMLKIDTLTWGAKHASHIFNCFVERGILNFNVHVKDEQTGPFKIENSHGFTFNNEPLTIRNTKNTSIKINLINALGQVVYTEVGQTDITLLPQLLAPGMYNLRCEEAGKIYSFKIIKH